MALFANPSINGQARMHGEQCSIIPSLFCRLEAIPLVDAFDIPDAQLNSALGRYDGDVYKHLFDWALKAPRNKEKVCVCGGGGMAKWIKSKAML